MYNRYIRNDEGIYDRVSVREVERRDNCPSDRTAQAAPLSPAASPGEKEQKRGILSSLLGRLTLSELDSGDLMLLAILYLLFKDGGDEELLIALGLLLIL